jgi:DNA-binding IclR family transcriptional regulator
MLGVSAEASERDYVQSLERGFAVLLAFKEQMTNPILAELATATGYSRPAVRRLLLTLQRLGYVANEGARWSLTPRVLPIGQHYTAANARILTPLTAATVTDPTQLRWLLAEVRETAGRWWTASSRKT